MIWFLWACTPEVQEVQVTGTVFADRFDDSDAVADASVQLMDGALRSMAEITTDTDGAFEGTVAGGGLLYVDLSADGCAPTGFSGQVGFVDYPVPDGALWMRSEEDTEEIAAEFEGCSGAGEEDMGLLEGVVELYVPGGDADDVLRVPDAWVAAATSEGERVDACYQGEDGVYDATATGTGPNGRFALWGPTGLVAVEVGYTIGEQVIESKRYAIYIPENGVAPFYPFWVSLPL
jgi:hypothetical protein